MDTTIVNEIISQLGGGRFKVMTGAHTFVARDAYTLSFRLRSNGSKANYVEIRLNGKDLYDLRFYRVRGIMPTKRYLRATAEDLREWNTPTLLQEYTDLYNDMLIPTFEQYTKLYTRL